MFQLFISSIFYLEKIRSIIFIIIYLFFFFGSTFLPFIWFWFLSETKWMRYSQHFIVIILISLFYFLSSEILTEKTDLLVIGSLILIFIDNYKLLSLISLALIVFILFSNSKNNKIYFLKNYNYYYFISRYYNHIF